MEKTADFVPHVIEMESNDFATAKLPVNRDLRWGYLLSLMIAALTGTASAAGLLYPDIVYPTAELQHTYLANDIFTLVLGLPILLVSMWLAWRGRPIKIGLIGLLFWPGALLYGLYNYTAYLFGMPFQGLFFLYLVIVVLSLYALIGLVTAIDGESVKQRLAGHVPERLGGGVLVLFGAAYMLLASVTIISILSGQAALPQAEAAVFVADFIMAPAWVIGGALLWRHDPLGYVGGTGLLFSASMLFVGVIGIVLLQAVLEGAAFPLMDVILLSGMGLVCFIPFSLFVRGAVKS